MKKIISLIVCFLIILSIPIASFAEETRRSKVGGGPSNYWIKIETKTVYYDENDLKKLQKKAIRAKRKSKVSDELVNAFYIAAGYHNAEAATIVNFLGFMNVKPVDCAIGMEDTATFGLFALDHVPLATYHKNGEANTDIRKTAKYVKAYIPVYRQEVTRKEVYGQPVLAHQKLMETLFLEEW